MREKLTLIAVFETKCPQEAYRGKQLIWGGKSHSWFVFSLITGELVSSDFSEFSPLGESIDFCSISLYSLLEMRFGDTDEDAVVKHLFRFMIELDLENIGGVGKHCCFYSIADKAVSRILEKEGLKFCK